MITLRRLPFLPAIVVSGFLTSCGEGEPDAVWHGSVSDSAGITIVRNQGTPLWREVGRLTFSEVLKIGAVEGESQYIFGQVKGIGVLSDGRIVVSDGMAQHLRFFYPDGQFQKTVGGPGSGPGEFGPGGLTVLVGPGDTLLVADQANLRANRIAPDGTWLDSWRFTPEDGWLVRGWDAAPTGRIVTHMSRVPGMETSESDTFDVVVVRKLDGSTGDTLATVPASRLRRRSGQGPEFHFYAGEPDIALCSDGSLVTGRGDRYRLLWYDPDGKLQRIVTLERENLPLTEEDQAFVIRRFEEQLKEAGLPIGRIAQMKTAVRFTDTYPAFVLLECGPRGTIWVQQVRPVSSLSQEERADFWVGPIPEASSTFDVFDREGKYLGIATLPPGFWLRRFHGDHAYGRWRDSLDVEYLMVLRIDGLPQQH